MVILFIGVCAAFLCHTDESRLFAQAITSGFAACGKKHDAMAECMGLTPQMLSRQLAGREPLSVYRLVMLPADVQIAIFTIHLKLLGAEVIGPDHVRLLKGAAALGLRKTAKMLSFVNEEPQRKEA